MVKFCRHCGTSMRDEATFCGQCGQGKQIAESIQGSSLGGSHRIVLIIAAIGLMLTTALVAAIQSGNVRVPWTSYGADKDGDGIISGDEAWAELEAMPNFQPGKWMVEIGDGSNPFDVGPSKFSQNNFKRILPGLFFDTSPSSISASMDGKILKFDMHDGVIDTIVCFSNNKWCAKTRGSYDNSHYTTKLDFSGSPPDGYGSGLVKGAWSESAQ